MDNKLHYAHTFFCSHLAAVGRASEVQAAGMDEAAVMEALQQSGMAAQ